MAKKQRVRDKGDKKAGAEFRFRMDAFTPRTLPMERLADYLKHLSEMLGEGKSLHLIKVADGSAAPVIWVEHEAIPKVRDRAEAVRRADAPPEAIRAYRRINTLLRNDNASADLKLPGRGKPILRFPGRKEHVQGYGAVRQQGSIDGIVNRVGGKDESSHVLLETDGVTLSNIDLTKETAKRLAHHLYEPVRLYGMGKWRREPEGAWILESFTVQSFEPLDSASLSAALDKIRAIPTEWTDESYKELRQIRHGPEGSHGRH